MKVVRGKKMTVGKNHRIMRENAEQSKERWTDIEREKDIARPNPSR